MGWNYLSIPKLQRCNRWSLGMDKWFHPTLYWACDYLSMLGLKLNHVSKRGHKMYHNDTWSQINASHTISQIWQMIYISLPLPCISARKDIFHIIALIAKPVDIICVHKDTQYFSTWIYVYLGLGYYVHSNKIEIVNAYILYLRFDLIRGHEG